MKTDNQQKCSTWQTISHYIAIAEVRLALQAAIAAALAVLAYQFFGIKNGYWVLVTVLVVMQANIGSSIKRAGQRILGTFLGAVFSVLLFHYVTTNVIILSYLFLICLFLQFAIPLWRYTAIAFFVTISVLVGLELLIITAMGSTNTTSNFIAVRLADTCIGISIGVLVSLFVFPNRAGRALRNSIANGLRATDCYFQAIATYYLVTENQSQDDNIELLKQPLIQTLQENRTYLSQHKFENMWRKTDNYSLYQLLLMEERLLELLTFMASYAEFHCQESCKTCFDVKVKEIVAEISDVLHKIATAVETRSDFPKIDALYDTTNELLRAIEQESQQLENTPTKAIVHLTSFLYDIQDMLTCLQRPALP